MDDVGIVSIGRWIYDYPFKDGDDIRKILEKNVPNWDSIPPDTQKDLIDIGESTDDVDYIRRSFKSLPTRQIEKNQVQPKDFTKPSFAKRIGGRIKSFFKRRK